MRKSKILIAGFLFLQLADLNAQGVGGSVTPGGGSAGTGGGGSNIVNVDPYTGIGSVNIPIHSYGVDELDLGVSLSYNAKGVTVDELASPVGLGWNLNAGGSITREVRGVEDEITFPTKFKYTDDPVAWIFYYPLKKSAHDTLQGILVPDVIIPMEGSANKPWWFTPGNTAPPVYDDLQSDIFHLNIGGRSIDFAFHPNNGTISYITSPKTEVEIKLFTKDMDLVNGGYTNIRNGVQKDIGFDSTHNILSFEVTDEKGNKFYFERGDYQTKAFELQDEMFTIDTGVHYVTSQWILDRIVTYTGLEIKYTYARKYMEYIEAIAETEYPTPQKFLVVNPNDPNESDYFDDNFDPKRIWWKGVKTHISKIEYPNGVSVLFDLDYTNGARCECRENFRLKNIKIDSRFSADYKNTITYVLNQVYFNTPKSTYTTTEINYAACNTIESNLPSSVFTTTASRVKHTEKGVRLQLKSISRLGTDNNTSELYYSFDYNSTPLPYRFDGQKDCYGYFNNAALSGVYNHVLYGAIFLSLPSSGIIRSFNFSEAQACVITKIKSGLGGETSIQYLETDVNTFENPTCSYGDLHFPGPSSTTYLNCDIDGDLQGVDECDGLVVWKLIDDNKYNVQSSTTTTYTYYGGKRFNRGGYFWYPLIDAGTPRVNTNYFVNPQVFVNGSNHGFDATAIMVTGYNNQQLSKSKLYFTNLIYDDGGNPRSCFRLPTGLRYHTLYPDVKKYRMGLLIKSESYDEIGNVVSRSENNFQYVAENDSLINKSELQPAVIPPASGPQVYSWGWTPPWDFNVLDYERMQIGSSTTTRFIKDPLVTNVKSLVTHYDYTYDAKGNIKSITWDDSKGITYRKWRYYNYNYNMGAGSAINNMNSRNMQHMISSEVWKMSGSDSSLLSYELIAPDLSTSTSSPLRFPASFGTAISEPLSSSQVFATTPAVNRSNALSFSNSSITDFGSHLQKAKQYQAYDSKGNVLQMKINDKDFYESFIWDSHFEQKIAEVKNAQHSEIAFTSFDGVYTAFGTTDENKGNWIFDPNYQYFYSDVPIGNAMTGNYVYKLVQGTSNTSYLKTNLLSHSKPYILSYWLHAVAGGNISVELFTGTNSASLTPVLQNTVGDWKLYTIEFTPAANDYVKIYQPQATVGANIYIDEVRLYPVGSSMIPTTYKPLFGPGSTCDANNYVSYYEYDAQGRLTIVRDMRGNIISKKETSFKGTDFNNNPSTPPNPTY